MSKASRKARKNRSSQEQKGIFFLNSTGVLLSRRSDCPWWERISQGFSLVILTLFPLYIGREKYSNITVTKFRAFVVLTCVYMVLCAVIAAAFPPGEKKGREGRSLPLQRPVLTQILLFAYMLWAVICTLISPYKDLWIGQNRYEGLCSLLLYGVVFLLLSFWGEYTDAFFYGLAITGAVMGVIAFAQSFGAKIFYPEGYTYWNSCFLTTIGNEDCVAGYINILIPALLCGFVILNGKWKNISFPAIFIMSYLGAFTDVDTAKMGYFSLIVLLPFLFQSRERFARLLIGIVPVLAGAALARAYEGRGELRHFAPGKISAILVLAAAVSMTLGVLLSLLKKEWPVKPVVIRRSGYIVMILLILAGLVYVFSYSGDSVLLKEASQFLHGNLSDTAGSFRGYIWKSTLKLIMERPLAGSGPGSFYFRFGPFNEGYRAVSGLTASVDFAHNDFLNIGVCTGLVGLGLYIAFLVSLAVRCARVTDRCPVILIFMAGMAGYLLYSFFVFSIAIVSPVFWVMAGLADKCVRQASG